MYLIYNISTGEQVGELVDTMEGRVLQPGFAAVEVPASALGGTSRWVATVRGFVDFPALDATGLHALFTEAELQAVLAAPAALSSKYLVLRLAAHRWRPADAAVQAFFSAAVAGGVLTQARANQILLFNPEGGQ